METKRLELMVGDFRIVGIKNNYRNAILYFINERTGITKEQVFINGAKETRFLLSALDLDDTKEWKDYWNELSGKSINLVLEKKIHGRIVAISNEMGEFSIINNEYFDKGENFLPDGNILYFERVYGVDSENLTTQVREKLQKVKLLSKRNI